MYTAPGKRVSKIAAATLNHGQAVVQGNHVGVAIKTDQVAWNVLPTDAAVAQIASGSPYELDVTGVHEFAVSGTLASAAVGDLVWIRPSDNSLRRTAFATGDLPFGVIDEIDTTRSPAVARINLNDRAAFAPHA